MKNKLKIYTLYVILLLLSSCIKDLPPLNDCNVEASFTYQILDPNCTGPCPVQFTNQSKNANSLLWLFGDDNTSMESSTSFVYEYASPGVYTIKLRASQDGNCPTVEVEEREVSIGVFNPPVAEIKVDTTCCIVGSCDITFSYTPEHADSWEWEIEGEDDNYENETSFIYSFNERVGTFAVKLIVSNSSATVEDIVNIIVKPITFEIKHDLLTAAGHNDKVLCVEEKEDGNFLIAVNSTLITATAEFSRNGELIEGSKDEIPLPLNENYPYQEAFHCYKGPNGYLLTGGAFYNLSSNNDAYVIGLNNNFSLAKAPTPIHYSGADGNEFGFTSTKTHDGGYLIGGQKSTNSPTGMYFVKLDASFCLDNGIPEPKFVHYPGESNNRVNGMATLATDFAVVGRKFNPTSSSLEGCFFKMTKEFDLISESLKYFGNFIPLSILYQDDNNLYLIGGEGNTGKIIKINSEGTQIWDIPASYNNSILTVGIKTNDGHVAISGYRDASGLSIPVLIKLHSDTGEEMFYKEYEEEMPQGISREIFSLAQTSDNGFILGGKRSDGQLLLIRTDSTGEK